MAQWSHTRIQSFRNCPRKYWYKYVAKVPLPDEPDSVERFLGKRVHETLESVYRQAMNGKPPALETVLADYRALWDGAWSDAVVIVDTSLAPADYRAIGERCLADYHARHAPFTATRTMAIEQVIGFVLDPARKVRMTGFIDRIARTADGVWQIHDYKTDKRLPTQADKDVDPQLAYYQIGLRELWPDAERVELTWHYLRFDQQIVSRRDAAQLAAVREAALVTIDDAVGRGRDEDRFETHETALCRWCEYQTMCPIWRHRLKIEELPRNEFLGEPGVQLVDRWSALDGERRELAAKQALLEDEIERLKEALFELADRERLDVVAGSEQEAAIKRAERTVFPRKTVEPEHAAALEELLRSGPWWSRVSALDRHALEKLWADPRLDDALRMVLQPFVTRERERSARLRKRRG